MSTTQTLTTDSFKEVTNRNHSLQPGLEAVYFPPRGATYTAHPVADGLPEKSVPGLGKRKVNFWLYLAVGILGLAVIGLAVGMGVGLSRVNGEIDGFVTVCACSELTFMYRF
ncbi:hypothetical protein BJX63DRAFT_385619 [Aspergillus granulosus]|uniref:Uncharacterized protein n=1 Tax=Aspergillus granulosus TaxID=176169 RepID=A0ABR4HQ94_9EURO